jgi:hypothetical protein
MEDRYKVVIVWVLEIGHFVEVSTPFGRVVFVQHQ